MKRLFLYFLFIIVLSDGQLLAQYKDIDVRSSKSRIAFVIGNQNYQNHTRLSTTLNDVDSISRALRRCDFEVYSHKNLTYEEMDDVLRFMANKLETGEYNTVLWYYTGHGVEIDKQNFQLPIDAPAVSSASISSLKYKSLQTKAISDVMKENEIEFPIIFLDACRTNLGKGTDGDFSEVNIDGLFVGLSTSQANKSYEGHTNGYFTQALLKHIHTPCLTIGDIFIKVKSDCKKSATQDGYDQEPKSHSDLGNLFYFVPCESAQKNTVNITASVLDSDGDGVPDKSDKCRTEFGKLEWEGCPDSDGDGIPNHKDKCPELWGERSDLGCPTNKIEKDVNLPTSYTDESVYNRPIYEPKDEKEVLSIPSFPYKEVVKKVRNATIYMVKIQGSNFMIGNNSGKDDEKPAHEVSLGNYHISKYEVTNKLWNAVMDKTIFFSSLTPSKPDDDFPKTNVSWDSVYIFISELNKMTENNYRLPTEEEWEFAAKGGQNYLYAGSDNPSDVAWHSANSGSKPHPVGQKKPNNYGIFDMSGNVKEWVSSKYLGNYVEYYPQNKIKNKKLYVTRGGNFDEIYSNCTIYDRNGEKSSSSYRSLGFRLAHD